MLTLVFAALFAFAAIGSGLVLIETSVRGGNAYRSLQAQRECHRELASSAIVTPLARYRPAPARWSSNQPADHTTFRAAA